MATITIPKTEYHELKKKADAYELIFRVIQEGLFVPPPTRSGEKMMRELKKSGKYNAAFLNSLKRGFRRSSYFTK